MNEWLNELLYIHTMKSTQEGKGNKFLIHDNWDTSPGNYTEWKENNPVPIYVAFWNEKILEVEDRLMVASILTLVVDTHTYKGYTIV